MERTNNFTQNLESHFAQRNRGPEGHLLLAISLDKFVKQVTADSTTRGSGFVLNLSSLELAFCLASSKARGILDLFYVFIFLF